MAGLALTHVQEPTHLVAHLRGRRRDCLQSTRRSRALEQRSVFGLSESRAPITDPGAECGLLRSPACDLGIPCWESSSNEGVVIAECLVDRSSNGHGVVLDVKSVGEKVPANRPVGDDEGPCGIGRFIGCTHYGGGLRRKCHYEPAFVDSFFVRVLIEEADKMYVRSSVVTKRLGTVRGASRHVEVTPGYRCGREDQLLGWLVWGKPSYVEDPKAFSFQRRRREPTAWGFVDNDRLPMPGLYDVTPLLSCDKGYPAAANEPAMQREQAGGHMIFLGAEGPWVAVEADCGAGELGDRVRDESSEDRRIGDYYRIGAPGNEVPGCLDSAHCIPERYRGSERLACGIEASRFAAQSGRYLLGAPPNRAPREEGEARIAACARKREDAAPLPRGLMGFIEPVITRVGTSHG